MTIILALDSTQENCSVALAMDEQIITQEQKAPRLHAKLILPQIESVLAKAQLELKQVDALAFACGPGRFTGLRIAAGVTQGLALGADLPVIAISSLAVMAQGQYRINRYQYICPAFDARIQKIYWGQYRLVDGLMQAINPDTLSDHEQLHLPEANQWAAVGSGWAAYPQMGKRLSKQITKTDPQATPWAQDIIPIAKQRLQNGQVLDALSAVPVYLRDEIAKTISQRKQEQGNHSQ